MTRRTRCGRRRAGLENCVIFSRRTIFRMRDAAQAGTSQAASAGAPGGFPAARPADFETLPGYNPGLPFASRRFACKLRTAHRRHRRTVTMAHFSCFPGASALSDFRQTRLLETLARIDSNIVGVRGQYLHFVNSAEPLSDEDTNRIHALMHYGAPFEEQKERGNVAKPSSSCRALARCRRGRARRPTSRITAGSRKCAASSAASNIRWS